MCQDNWPEARSFIKQGTFASYFGAHGRKDLMQAAQDAAAASRIEQRTRRRFILSGNGCRG